MAPARPSYLLWSGLFYGPPLVGVLAYTVQEESGDSLQRVLGCSLATFTAAMVTLADFTLTCADEARAWMARLNM